MTPSRVGLLGASGTTGSSILEGLIEDGGFDIVAFARPASLSKPSNVVLKDRGVQLRVLDLDSSEATMAAALEGIEILISAVGRRDDLSQMPLATAAKKAGVKRFIPCSFGPVTPVGVNMSRDKKEEEYSFMKRLHLPYTIIEVGWWYQFSFPALPSGKIDYAMFLPNQRIPGDGNMLSALTDLRDVGKYVARIIKDERTVNTMVFVYNELWSQNQVYDLLEQLSGEKIPRAYIQADEYEQQIAKADAKLKSNPEDYAFWRLQKLGSQYCLSWGIRGDNTPEYAKYLGFLDGKALYPDLKFISFKDYLEEVISGKAKGVYEDFKPTVEKKLKEEQ